VTKKASNSEEKHKRPKEPSVGTLPYSTLPHSPSTGSFNMWNQKNNSKY
jgi:hypothetical protein